jgi:hypothetical protein
VGGAHGLLLFAGGNLGVLLAETRVPSGVTALLAASLALWMVLLDWLRPGGVRPTPAVVAGLALGTLGVAVLVGPGELAGAHGVGPGGRRVRAPRLARLGGRARCSRARGTGRRRRSSARRCRCCAAGPCSSAWPPRAAT